MSSSASTTETASPRARLAAGETLVGAFLNLGSPLSAELCATAGVFDWLVVDLEHGSGTESDLTPQLQAFARAGPFPLVRVPRLERLAIARALDAGALGVMVPRIETAEQAADAVSYMRYPPEGVRGVASSTRGALFGGDDNRNPLGVIQIESPRAVENAEAIAALDGVDVLFVGPSDLSASLVTGVDDPRVMEAADQVVAAARRAGKAAGIYAKGPTVSELAGRGFRFIAAGSDTGFLLEAIRAVRTA